MGRCGVESESEMLAGWRLPVHKVHAGSFNLKAV